ncbi:MAG TPA: UMP kinase [Chloroflexota bacterium]|jgi:uridylate kinase|nr:UMP kinase [Chloroflexota bacterium]
MADGLPYRRVLIKLSGEALAGEHGFGIDPTVARRRAEQLVAVHALGIEMAVVVGAGNIFRGMAAASKGMERTAADYMGMLGTVMNSLALQSSIEDLGVPTRLQTAIEMRQVAEPFIRRRAIRHMEKGRIVIFAAGTGNPYFTTDTAAVLRCIEINGEVLLMGKNGVDAVYNDDPRRNPAAVRFTSLDYMDALTQRLQVMDGTALTLCMENKLPIIVFDANGDGNLVRAARGERVGTYVGEPSALAGSPYGG